MKSTLRRKNEFSLLKIQEVSFEAHNWGLVSAYQCAPHGKRWALSPQSSASESHKCHFSSPLAPIKIGNFQFSVLMSVQSEREAGANNPTSLGGSHLLSLKPTQVPDPSLSTTWSGLDEATKHQFPIKKLIFFNFATRRSGRGSKRQGQLSSMAVYGPTFF